MVKILAIGNSFSQDATARLYELAAAAGEELKVVNLYIGGCPLSSHAFNALGRRRDYKLEYNGFLTNFDVSVHDALVSDAWDAVTLQQLSGLSVNYDTYQPYLTILRDYILTYVPSARLMVHQTWPYEDGGERLAAAGFASSAEMMEKLRAAYRQAADFLKAPLIPAGEAVFSAAAEKTAPMYRDGFHLSLGAGRYTAACVWLETLTGLRADSLPDAAGADLDPAVRRELQAAAHRAAAGAV